MSEVKNSDTRNVVIYPIDCSLPSGLRETLKAKNISSQSFTSERELISALSNQGDEILLVFCSENAKLDKVTLDLSYQKTFHSLPLIIVGKDVDKYESFLNKFFVLATTITLPCQHTDIISAIKYVSRYIDKIKKTKQRSPESKETISTPTFDSSNYKLLYQEFPNIPSLAFNKLKELGLFSKDVGGVKYATVFRPQNLEQKPFLPSSPKLLDMIAQATENLSDERRSRFMRIAMLSHFIVEALGLSSEFKDYTKFASSFYSLELLNDSKYLTQQQYLIGDIKIVRKDLCSRIKDSLINQEDKIPNNESKKIILLVAKLIGEEEALDNSAEGLSASAIATADAIDRVIYRRNVFQPVAAYSVLSLLKKEEISFIHPLVLAVLVKLLAEAVTSKISIMNKASRIYEFTSLLEVAKEIDSEVIDGSFRAVPIMGLEPGMRVANGINTEDGKALISDTVELDQDLIWRLWQLSAIRPLQKNVYVKTNSKGQASF